MSEHTPDAIWKLWRDAGGSFHGPHVEHATMPESDFLPFMERLLQERARYRSLVHDLKDRANYRLLLHELISEIDTWIDMGEIPLLFACDIDLRAFRLNAGMPDRDYESKDEFQGDTE